MFSWTESPVLDGTAGNTFTLADSEETKPNKVVNQKMLKSSCHI